MPARDPRGGAEPLLAWPGVASLRLTLPLSYLFFKIFLSIYGGASLLAGLRGAHTAFHFSWELKLPFVPSVALIYLSVPLVLALTPFVLRTWRTFMPFFLTLTAETLVAGLFFLVLPVAQGYPQRVASGFFGGIFRFADRLNLDYNEFPSLSIAFAITAALVFGRRCGWLGRTAFAVWAMGVCTSALLMHEHHLLDIAGGAVLGLAAVASVQRRTADDAFLQVLRIDALCLAELARSFLRLPRYMPLVATLFHTSKLRWREMRRLRAAYCLEHLLDDLLDGDRKAPNRDPEAYAHAILRGLAGEAAFGNSTAEQLAEYLAGELPEETKRQLIELIEMQRVDRRRMDARWPLDAARLAEHHRKAFSLSLDLTFRLAGVKLRAADAPDLLGALAWVSAVRDREADLERGLINFPREVLEAAGWHGGEEDLRPFLDTPAVGDWQRREQRQGAAFVAALGSRLAAVNDRRERAVLDALHRALAAYERKVRRTKAGALPVFVE